MDENEELAKELGERVITLSEFVGYFEARSEEQRGDELVTQINKLKRLADSMSYWIRIAELISLLEKLVASGRTSRNGSPQGD